MKKFSSFLILLVVVLFSSTAIAGSYLAKAGDTLSGIAKKSGNNLTAVMLSNPQLKNFNHIKIGQVIFLPENDVKKNIQIKLVSNTGMIWRHVGADPYRGTAKWAIDKFDIPASIKEATLKNISNNIFEWVNVESGQLLGAVTFGKNKIKKSVRTQWDGKKYSAKNFGAGDYVVAKVVWCSNWVWWKKGEVISPPIQEEKQSVEIQEEPMLAVRELQEASVIPCKKCQDQGEFDSGAYWIVHDPGGKNENKGWGAFGEILFWRNFAEDCSSEYSWGVGALASAYGYSITNKPESGDGSRLTAQIGIKRNWTGKSGNSKQAIAKFRLGVQDDSWKNFDRDWHIDQTGPIAGIYTEYRHEVIYDQLWVYATVESWFGIGSQNVDSSFADTKPANRTFVEAVVGVDVRITDQDIARAYAGFDYQGWDDLIPGVIGAEIRHELEDDWGTISVGVQGKFYSTINPTALVYAKWEITTPLQRWYENSRQESVQLVGTGIGGNQFLSTTTIENHPASDRMEEVFASLSSNK